MNGFVAKVHEMLSESRRQLGIDQEPHVTPVE
jgi:hypothetical protein